MLYLGIDQHHKQIAFVLRNDEGTMILRCPPDKKPGGMTTAVFRRRLGRDWQTSAASVRRRGRRRTPAEPIQSKVAGGFGGGPSAPRNNATPRRTNGSEGVVAQR
jgi:hypothetical protein